MMSAVFPGMILIIIAMTIVGIKLGGRVASKLLFWLVFFPLFFILTEVLRKAIIGEVNNLGKTTLLIVVVVLVAAAIVSLWMFFYKKKVNLFFPLGERRPAGGAIAGLLMGFYLSVVFVVFLILLYPKSYTHFKFPIANGLYVDIDLSKKPFTKIHGKMEKVGQRFFATAPSGSAESGSASDTTPMPAAGDRSDPPKAEKPVWAQDPPDQTPWVEDPAVDADSYEFPVNDTIPPDPSVDTEADTSHAEQPVLEYEPITVPQERSERLN